MLSFSLIALLAACANAAPAKNAHTCAFPSDAGLVAITPESSNAGWAMSPDEQCTPGSFCPYACPPGQLMNQWDTKATTFTSSESMNGGLHCNSKGNASKPYPDREYCIDGTGTVSVDNTADSDVAFCQTVLPGDEVMLIPTNISSGLTQTLAVPSHDYWGETAAHYYINPLGVSTSEGCVWGSQDKPQGNWAPYVAGANMDSNGNTIVKIGWNPEYIDSFTDLPKFGIRITCSDPSACNGLECEIDPAKYGFNEVSSSNSAVEDGASFCEVTATNNANATIEVFDL